MVGIEKGPQASAPDDRRAHQGPGLEPVEDVQDVLGPGIALHVRDPDQPALGEVGDQVRAQVGQTELALRADHAVGPVPAHGYEAAFLVDLAIADPVGAQLGTEGPFDLHHDVVRR
ncbi:hypothetical protein GMDG_08962, partial [Pseudogymnoascus destructans 20631-21]